MSEVEMQAMESPEKQVTVSDTQSVGLDEPESQEGSLIEGVENPAFGKLEVDELVELPPMTFVDFTPMLIEEAASNMEAPRYDGFSTVLEQANQWLKSNTSFQVMKLESFTKRLGDTNIFDADNVLYHESSYGINKYVRGLRLWLAPREDPTSPPQEIGYLTSTPEPSDGSVSTAEAALALFTPSQFKSSTSIPSYCGMAETLERLNKFLKKKPVPGSILNVETLKVKYEETSNKCVDSEKMSWVDCGKAERIYIYAIRVYYIVGKPSFEVIGLHDEIPVCTNNWESNMNKMRFCPFTTVVQRARKWLQNQKGVRVINMQTVDSYCDRGKEGEAKVHSDKTGHVELPGTDTQFARVLRVFYIQDHKSDTCPYESQNLTTRLFIPARRGDYGRNCESFSKTMQRVIKWLQLTKTPIFGIETVNYPFSVDSYGSGVKEDLAVMSLVGNAGKYYITTVRLYFPCEFNEPAPELLPQPEEEQGWWGCSLS